MLNRAIESQFSTINRETERVNKTWKGEACPDEAASCQSLKNKFLKTLRSYLFGFFPQFITYFFTHLQEKSMKNVIKNNSSVEYKLF